IAIALQFRFASLGKTLQSSSLSQEGAIRFDDGKFLFERDDPGMTAEYLTQQCRARAEKPDDENDATAGFGHRHSLRIRWPLRWERPHMGDHPRDQRLARLNAPGPQAGSKDIPELGVGSPVAGECFGGTAFARS